ncbi:hypothetical protein PGB90_001710 [Kerria lacca]
MSDEISNITINEKLHEWEKLNNCSAPLSTFQRNACLDLGDEVISRVFPVSFPTDDPDLEIEKMSSSDVNIKASWQFLDWYFDLSNKWLEFGNERFELCLSNLIEKRDKCSDILKKVEEAIIHLNQLKYEYEQVSSKTNPLYFISQKLSDDQIKLIIVFEDINNKLNPFRTIENVIKRLESSAVAVTSEAFLNNLDDIDNCNVYFKEHETYKENANYQLRTRHCLSKALSDIKSYIISVLDTCKIVPSSMSLLPLTDVEEHSYINKCSKFVAFYGRFQSTASRVKPLLIQLENRIDKSYEYKYILEECQKYYINLRQQIINPSLKDFISNLVSSRMKDYCSLLRSISTYLIYLSQDEDKLYYQFFSKPSSIFSDFLESMCSVLYDTMRPLVIHMKHMETLAEFCSILRVEILQDHVQHNASLQPFGNIVEQLLRDVKERLVFRAHLYFKTDILQFNPSPGDLAYPEKLEMMKNISDEIRAQEIVSLNRYDSKMSLTSIDSYGDSIHSENRISKYPAYSSPADLHGMWYPTIRRTLVCLSRLYRYVEKAVFQGLAQEAIACCCENVNEATQIISKNKSHFDGQLFQIKHLLILREQIAPFQVDFTATEMSLDINQLKSAAFELWQKQKLFSFSSNNAILEFILHGSPLLRENYIDSRKIVDTQLKNACESFISYVTRTVVEPIEILFQQFQDVKKSNQITSIKENFFGKPDYIRDVVNASIKKIKSCIPSLLHKMELYLANPDTQFILYKPIKNNIVNTFSKMHALIIENYTMEDQLLIGCPASEQISVLLSSMILSKKINTDGMSKEKIQN